MTSPTPLTDAEWSVLAGLTPDDLVDLAVRLDVVIPANPEPRALLEATLPRLIAAYRSRGVPLSQYDHEDVAALSAQERATLASLQGLGAKASVRQIMAVGAKAYKSWSPRGTHHPVPFLTPVLLKPMLRLAATPRPAS